MKERKKKRIMVGMNEWKSIKSEVIEIWGKENVAKRGKDTFEKNVFEKRQSVIITSQTMKVIEKD